MDSQEFGRMFCEWCEKNLGPVASQTFIDGFFNALGRVPADLHRDWMQDTLVTVAQMALHSPIEGIFATEWMAAQAAHQTQLANVMLAPQWKWREDGELFTFDFALAPDVWPYRDLVRKVFDRGAFVVIELDGHEFHERTKEQVKARNRKDLMVQNLGFAIAHFSGSQIVGGPELCVAEVIKLARARGVMELGREAAERRAAGVEAQ